MRARGRVDATQAAIAEALRRGGASVTSLANMGNGVPDLLVGIRGMTYLIECKSERGGLSPDQARWANTWTGGAAVVLRSAEDAVRFLFDVSRAQTAPKTL